MTISVELSPQQAQLLAEAATRNLADRLEGRRLPTWFPRDLRVSAVVR
jgi:hypothetical protein